MPRVLHESHRQRFRAGQVEGCEPVLARGDVGIGAGLEQQRQQLEPGALLSRWLPTVLVVAPSVPAGDVRPLSGLRLGLSRDASGPPSG